MAATRKAPASPARKPAAKVPPPDADLPLLEAIARDPAATGPRDAHLAWCLGHDPARAELIALGKQRLVAPLANADADREAALVKKHAKRWLGPLASTLVAPRPADFEQGYLARAMFSASARKPELSVGDPRWATIEAIAFQGIPRVPIEVFLHPALQSFRKATGVSIPFFDALSSHDRPLLLQDLDTEGPDVRSLDPSFDPPALASVRSLSVSTWVRLDRAHAGWQDISWLRPLWMTRWLTRIDHVRITCPPHKPPTLLAELDAHVPPAVSACFHVGPQSFVRGPSGRFQRAP